MNPRRKLDTIITSTPIRKTTIQLMEIEGLSPVERSSHKSPIPNVPIEKHERLDKIAEAKSVDKICIVDRNLKISDTKKVSEPNNVDVESEIKKARQLVIMDSDEEEIFWQNRNKIPKRRKKRVINENKKPSTNDTPITKTDTQEQVESVKPESNVKITVNIIEPKNTADINKAVSSPQTLSKKKLSAAPVTAEKFSYKRSKSALKIWRNSTDEASENSDQSDIVKPIEKLREKVSKDDENTVRRSNRQRCKPLEFWNGERMNIDKDSGIGIVLNGLDFTKKKIRKIQGSRVELEREKLEEDHQIHTNEQNSENEHKPEPSSIKKSRTKNTRSILKSKTKTNSKSNVRFSNIGTGTTIDGPTNKSNIKLDWVANFAGLHSAKQSLPGSENCFIFPGLNTSTGIISSAIIQICPKASNQSRAPYRHHLMFCVMVGTVTVTIDKISVRMATYGHFTVPCGVLYSIENIGRKNAVLSFFKIACSCVRT